MNNKHLKFLSYLNTPLSKESIAMIYDANNIQFDKCELYGDFVSSLLVLVFDTYLGDDITPAGEQVKHFKWCWDKNVDNFKLEGINIESDNLYEYFLEYMLEVFYFSDKMNQNDNLRLWNDLFNYSKNRTQSDMDTFVEVYKLFEKSLKN
jgi:hypothetical protein